MKNFARVVFILLICFNFVISKEVNSVKFPKAVSKILDKALKEEISQDDLNLKFVRELYYPAQGGELYFVQFIKADLPPIEEGKPAHVFLRLYNSKGKKVKDLYSPIEKNFEIYSCPVTFSSEKHKIAILLATNDLTKLSVKIKEVDGKKLLNLRELSTTPVVFLKSMEKLQQPVTTFKCYDGSFPLGTYMLYPYLEEKFKGGETPGLFFFILGAQLQKPTNTYNLVVSYQIKKDNEVLTKFPKQQLTYSVVYQPIPLKSHAKPLQPGVYELDIKIQDVNARKNIEKKVPFEIIDNDK